MHRAAREALQHGSERVRRLFPSKCCDLTGVGEFCIEDCGGSDRYAQHMEAWNKARISQDVTGHCHVICAGLPRPPHVFHAEKWADGWISQGHTFQETAETLLGYNVTVDWSVCRYLQRDRPEPYERVREEVTDYLGDKVKIDVPRAIALYPSARELGDTGKLANRQNLDYLHAIGIYPEERLRTIGATDGRAWVTYDEEM